MSWKNEFILIAVNLSESLEDAEYVLSFLQKLESDLIYSDFLSKLNQNELYLQDLIFPDKNQKI